MKLCSPEGRALPRQGVAAVARPQSLAGLRIGLLDNTKPPVDKVMEHLATRLRERIPGAQPFYVSKQIMNQPAGATVLQALTERADVLINALAD